MIQAECQHRQLLRDQLAHAGGSQSEPLLTGLTNGALTWVALSAVAVAKGVF